LTLTARQILGFFLFIVVGLLLSGHALEQPLLIYVFKPLATFPFLRKCAATNLTSS
jgi:hypothetical protein